MGSLNKTDYVLPLKGKKVLTAVIECVAFMLHVLEVTGQMPIATNVFIVSFR
jgi:hypothetical protein